MKKSLFTKEQRNRIDFMISQVDYFKVTNQISTTTISGDGSQLFIETVILQTDITQIKKTDLNIMCRILYNVDFSINTDQKGEIEIWIYAE